MVAKIKKGTLVTTSGEIGVYATIARVLSILNTESNQIEAKIVWPKASEGIPVTWTLGFVKTVPESKLESLVEGKLSYK